jgi:hypothetical protein
MLLLRLSEKNRLVTDHLIARSATASNDADEAMPIQVLSVNSLDSRKG